MSTSVAREKYSTDPVFRDAVSVPLQEPNWAATEAVFEAIQALKTAPAEDRPIPDNIVWAERVMLGVLPRAYLRGADVQAFAQEIHATWEFENKTVVAFLPAPNALRVYREWQANEAVNHNMVTADNDPLQLRTALQWLFS